MRRVHLPSPALAVALLALVLAAGGTSYAVSALPRNSVGTAQLKNHAVTTTKLATSASARVAGLTIRKASVTVTPQTMGVMTVPCPKGLAAISGGVETPHSPDAFVLDSHPVAGGWELSVGNTSATEQPVSFYAVCVQAAKGTPKISTAARAGAQFHSAPLR